MKQFIVFLFILAMSIPSNGQSTQKRYVSRITSDGTTFFINPHQLNSLTHIRRFEYDMTLLSWTDSVTVNFTIESMLMDSPKNLKLVSGDKSYSCEEFSVLFTDIKRNHYEIRVTSKFSVTELSEIVAASSTPVFSFTQQGISASAAYKKNEWTKERKKLSDILQLYVYSKK